MSGPARKMHLALSVASLGYHVGCWRLPETDPAATMTFAHYAELARLAERGKFDMIFLADVMAARETTGPADVARRIHHAVRHDPLMLLAALAPLTARVGLVATASSTYTDPFTLARRFASLDHISGGRAGWNVVTGYNVEEAQNLGYDKVPGPAHRYGRVYETLDAAKGLWDSWDDDAFLYDKDAGVYFDPARLHVLNHKGEHFSIRGPLDVARPPQGYPVFVTAGESDAAQELAAAQAEVVYAGLPSIAAARAYYGSVKDRMAKYNRAPEGLKILTGIMAIVAETEAEARAKRARLMRMIDPGIGMRMIRPIFGDLSALGLDERVPDDVLEAPERTTHNDFAQRTTIATVLAERVRRDKLTVRQLYEAIAEGYWQLSVTGTPKMVADAMEEWFAGGACDGFIVQPPYQPGASADFVALVVPELQRRGLFRADYDGPTLRDHLGLARPASRYAA